jgi:glyceraldehyde-3-phosphate dehydrogenase (NADP+)
VLAITPFNDPLNLVAHKLGPAIAGGNTVVLKPATVTPLSALKLTEAFVEAGLPPGVLQCLTGHGAVLGDAMVSDPRVRMVSFTGGVEAGERIVAKAGLKKIGMELGSNSPVVVWKDADIEWAAETCVSGAFWAAGQNCIGVQRIYIHSEVYDRFRDLFVKLTERYIIGDKMDEATNMGPMITEGEADRVERWIAEAVEKGATIAAGGTRTGTLVAPTVLENVPHDATIHSEEVFGPTVNLYRFDDLDDAIEQANSADFGLHAAGFARDVEVCHRLIEGLDAGSVLINDSTDYRLDSMPFGGVKGSGLGREGIKFSLQEMTEPKVVCWYLPGL